ncbi:MAG: hypothetical protein HY976_03205 [Candidatus Kerfeldbacteria bacterium]|nr:hypothetical protein [Candidatus Kerfeldbacteria bacterium]
MRKSIPVIVINGAPGVGKSTLAHALWKKLDIRHSAGSQTILHTHRALFPRNKNNLPVHSLPASTSTEQVRRFLQRQARYIAPAVNFVIEKNSLQGIPFILEGIHLFPQYVTKKVPTLFITIAAPPKRKHLLWLLHRNIVHPTIFSHRLAATMNRIYLKEAQTAGTMIIRDSNLRKRVRAVERALARG